MIKTVNDGFNDYRVEISENGLHCWNIGINAETIFLSKNEMCTLYRLLKSAIHTD